jgi:hypothetical protein
LVGRPLCFAEFFYSQKPSAIWRRGGGQGAACGYWAETPRRASGNEPLAPGSAEKQSVRRGYNWDFEFFGQLCHNVMDDYPHTNVYVSDSAAGHLEEVAAESDDNRSCPRFNARRQL